MENITHVTNKGTSEFGLANTNKLLKQYQYTTGLKTGSTSKAKYCVSATAKKDDVEMIAVIMGAPDYKVRFSEAKTLLEYGFNICRLYKDVIEKNPEDVKVNGGKVDKVSVMYDKEFSYICKNGEKPEDIVKEVILCEEVEAPVNRGDIIGKATYKLNGEVIGEVNIVAEEGIEKADYIFNLLKVIKAFSL